MRAITEAERATFDDLLTLAGSDAVALVNTELDGRDVAVVCAIVAAPDDSGDSIITPYAILVDDDLMARLAQP